MTPREAPVEIVPHDPAWPRLFDEEKNALLPLLRPWLVGPIVHIGSTAIPGLVAKPVIDMMAAVETLDASRPAIVALAALGYIYAPYRVDSEHWFCKPSPAFRTHHLHLVRFESAEWIGPLAFRDYLRTHADAAAEYVRLKEDLAVRYRLDRESYTEAKGPFVSRITSLAMREREEMDGVGRRPKSA